MSVFNFRKGQRVTIPAVKAGLEGVQGVVSSGRCEMGELPVYIVQWLNPQKMNAAGIFEVTVGTVTQSELDIAQSTKMISKTDIDLISMRSFDDGRAHERVLAQAERERAAIAARRRKHKSAKRKR